MATSIQELSSDDLDYFVAKAENILYMVDTEGHVLQIDRGRKVYCRTADARMFAYSPTTDWRQGGPLLEKYRISVQRTGSEWSADIAREASAGGPTILIAAMRALVVLKYGATVELD